MYGMRMYQTTKAGVTMYPEAFPHLGITLVYPITAAKQYEAGGFTMNLDCGIPTHDDAAMSTFQDEVAVTALVQGF